MRTEFEIRRTLVDSGLEAEGVVERDSVVVGQLYVAGYQQTEA